MPDPYVREIGKVEDSTDETFLSIGVDYDCVSIGDWRFTGEHLEQFGRLFIAACWRSGAALKRMPDA